MSKKSRVTWISSIGKALWTVAFLLEHDENIKITVLVFHKSQQLDNFWDDFNEIIEISSFVAVDLVLIY